jgi:hypothetical protein
LQPSITYLNKGQLYEMVLKNADHSAANLVVTCQMKIGFQVQPV